MAGSFVLTIAKLAIAKLAIVRLAIARTDKSGANLGGSVQPTDCGEVRRGGVSLDPAGRAGR